jgi:hypothetical protein
MSDAGKSPAVAGLAAIEGTNSLLVILIGLLVFAIVLLFLGAFLPRRLRVDVSGAINAIQRGRPVPTPAGGGAGGGTGGVAARGPQALAGAIRAANTDSRVVRVPTAGAVALARPTVDPRHAELLATGPSAAATGGAHAGGDRALVVHMDGCGPCQMYKATLAKIDPASLPLPVQLMERREYAEKKDALGLPAVRAFPTTFVVRDGAVRDSRVGALDEARLRALLEG